MSCPPQDIYNVSWTKAGLQSHPLCRTSFFFISYSSAALILLHVKTNKQTNKQTSQVALRLCHCQMKITFNCEIFNHHFIFVFFIYLVSWKYIVDCVNFMIISGFVACPDLFTPVFFTCSISKVLPTLVSRQLLCGREERLGSMKSCKGVQLDIG